MPLNILKLDFFSCSLIIINLRATLQKFVEKHQFNVILLCFKQILVNYVFNISSGRSLYKIFVHHVQLRVDCVKAIISMA
jgi:hypothetical protein